MTSKLSRTRIARYAAEQLQAGNSEVIQEVAAYLVESRRTNEADLIVRIILERLEANGVVLADVTTATKLDETTKAELKRITGAKRLELREHVDPSVLGGIRIETPSRLMDATFTHRLTQLRERKI